ncbi:MAG: MFS transporter [Chloroflexi bacterium]|nr:MFS transporter [Chloroflexota bacterium]
MSDHKRSHAVVMVSFSFAIAFMLHLLLFCTAPMVTVIMDEMELSHADFGFIFAAAMISLVIFRIPWGLVGDRIGYLNSFRIALPLAVGFAVLRAFSPGYAVLLVSQFLLGVSLAMVLPCLPLIVKEWATGRPGLSTGIYVSGFAAGNATALALTPQLLKVMEWREVLLAYSGLAALVCLLWFPLARSRGSGDSGVPLLGLGRLLRDKYVWVLLLFMMAAMGSYDTLATWLPRVLEMKDLDKALASLLPLGFFIAGPVVGTLSDRAGNNSTIVAVCGVLAAASIVGISYAPFPLLLVCIFLAGFATIGVLTISLTMPARHERLSPAAGSVVGLTSALGNVGPLVMPVLFGFLIDVTDGFYASIFSVAALAGLAFILGSRIRLRG